MRINDLISENNVELDEKAQGMLSRMGNKLLKKMPGQMGANADVRLQIGDEANALQKDYYRYLAGTKQQPTSDNVLAFLRKRGYPTGNVEKLIGVETTSSKVGKAVGKGAVNVAKGVKAAASGIADLGKAAVDGAKAGMAAQDNKQGPQADAPKAEPTQQVAAPKQDIAAANADRSQNAAPAPQAAKPAPDKSAEQPTKAVPSGDGIKIAAAKKKPSGNVQPKIAAGESVDYTIEALMEKLSGGQLDKIFMLAVQDAVRRDYGGEKVDTGTGSAPEGDNSFFGGVKKGADAAKDTPTAASKPEPAADEPEQEAPAEPKYKAGDVVTWKNKNDQDVKAYVIHANDKEIEYAQSVAGQRHSKLPLDAHPELKVIDNQPQAAKALLQKFPEPQLIKQTAPQPTQSDTSQSGAAVKDNGQQQTQPAQDQKVGATPSQQPLPTNVKNILDKLTQAEKSSLLGML